MALISWGAQSGYFRKYGSSTSEKYTKFDDFVEGSTELVTTKGDKQEAKIEGGEVEAVRYAKNTYELTFSIRGAADRIKPFDDADGIVAGEYEVILRPEESEAYGLKIDRAVVSCEDTYSSAEGLVWKYTVSALKPETGDQVKMGKVKISEDGTLTFTEMKNPPSEPAV